MASNASNPAPLAKAAGLGTVAHGEAINVRVSNANLAEVQAEYVRRRTRLAPAIANAIAELHFARRAA